MMKDRVLVNATSTRRPKLFLNLLDKQQLLQGPPVTSRTNIETGAETSGAGVERKAQRQRLPNKLRTTRVVVTEVDDGNFEPNAPEEVLRQEYIYDEWPECQAQVYRFPSDMQ